MNAFPGMVEVDWLGVPVTMRAGSSCVTPNPHVRAMPVFSKPLVLAVTAASQRELFQAPLAGRPQAFLAPAQPALVFPSERSGTSRLFEKRGVLTSFSRRSGIHMGSGFASSSQSRLKERTQLSGRNI